MRPDDWGRSRIWRYRVEQAPPGIPGTVIVKSSKIGGGHIFREWASLLFLNELAPLRSLVPAFYGGNEALELLVLEDLGDVRGVADLGTLMEGDDPGVARDALLAHARSMALLHTTTVGLEREFGELGDRFPIDSRPISKDQFGHHFAWFLQALSRFDLKVSPELRREVDAIMAILLDPDAPRAFTRGDVCPSNVVYAAGKIGFHDFEMGAFRHVFLSVAYFRLFHLSCFNGSLIPPALQAEAEQAYFRAAAPLIPDPADARIDMAAAATALLIWMLSTTLDRALRRDRPRHLASYRQRLFAAMTLYLEHDVFSTPFARMAAAVTVLRDSLGEQWAEKEKAIPIFGAFRDYGQAEDVAG